MTEHIKITIPGTAPSKKNGFKFIWYRIFNKRKVPLESIAIKYSDSYVTWAESAVQHILKLRESGELPKTILDGQLVASFIFRRVGHNRVDLNNLYDGVLDLLSGNACGQSIKVDKRKYQVIKDDRSELIINHGGSIVLHNCKEASTEIYLSPFSMDTWGKVMALWHPGINIDIYNSSKVMMWNSEKKEIHRDNSTGCLGF